MENLKTILFYVLGVALLVTVSILFTGQVEVDIQPLPTSTPTKAPTPTTTPTVVVKNGCRPSPAGSSFGYAAGAPFTTTLVSSDVPGTRLVISGTVFANDCQTPLPGTLVELWHNDPSDPVSTEARYLRGQMRTGVNGSYHFTTIQPIGGGSWPPHVHFRLTYPDDSGSFTTALFFDEGRGRMPALDPAQIVLPERVGNAEDVRLTTAFDINLPVEPPPAGEPDCAATPINPTARQLAARAPFTTTLATPTHAGSRLVVSGTVYAADGHTPLPGAMLIVWHADAEGHYGNDVTAAPRARMIANGRGQFEFTTIRPGAVPVGCRKLPAHINYLVSYGQHRTLFLMQFFADDPLLAEYPAMRQGVITPLEPVGDRADSTWRGVFDITMSVPPVEATPSITN